MSIATVADLRDKIDYAPRVSIHKKPFVLTGPNIGPGRFIWDYFGSSGLPTTGTVTSATLAGTLLDKTTVGAIDISSAQSGSFYSLVDIQGSAYWQDNPSQSYGGTDFYIHLFDRVWQNSGISTVTTTRQSWSPPALTRYTTGKGLTIWLRLISSALSADINVTIEYVNQDNVSRTFTFAPRFSTEIFVWAPEIICLPLQLNDTGVRSISAITFSGAWPQSANVGLMLAKYLGCYRIGSSSEPSGISPNSFMYALPSFDGNACLSFAIQAAGVYNATAVNLTMPEVALEAKVLAL